MNEPYMQRQVLVDPFGNTMTRDVEVYDAEIVSEEYLNKEENDDRKNND